MKSRIFLTASAAWVAMASTSLIPTLAATSRTYTVQPGDTFYKISKAQGVSLSTLEAANPGVQNFNSINIGDTLHLPNSVGSLGSGASTGTPSSTSEYAYQKAQAVIATAESLLGVPYCWGGDTPTTGFDCSGFVNYVFARHGITLPRESHDQASVGTPVSTGALQPGDLLFFTNTDSYANLYANQVTHVGIYVGNGTMIESSSAHNNQGVVIVKNVFSNPYYAAHYYGARDVIR